MSTLQTNHVDHFFKRTATKLQVRYIMAMAPLLLSGIVIAPLIFEFIMSFNLAFESLVTASRITGSFIGGGDL